MKQVTQALLACAVVGLDVSASNAVEPYILPVAVQEFALKNNLAAELGIEWADASPEKIAEYVHTLTAIDVVAQRIAQANEREEPTLEDFQAAAAAWCKFDLPGKPEEIVKYSDVAAGAYTSTSKQAAIENAVGPVLLDGSLEGFGEYLNTNMPDINEYRQNILDFSIIER